MRERLRFLLTRLRERLWIKPLFACALSVAGVLLAHLADRLVVDASVPEVTQTSIVELLKIIAASMLASATFALVSMVSAYASAGQVAGACGFPQIVADDVPQNARSTFIGAFIFSVVGISAAMNGCYGRAGRQRSKRIAHQSNTLMSPACPASRAARSPRPSRTGERGER